MRKRERASANRYSREQAREDKKVRETEKN